MVIRPAWRSYARRHTVSGQYPFKMSMPIMTMRKVVAARSLSPGKVRGSYGVNSDMISSPASFTTSLDNSSTYAAAVIVGPLSYHAIMLT